MSQWRKTAEHRQQKIPPDIAGQKRNRLQNLLKIVTASHLEGFYYKPRVDKEFLRKHSEGLIALSACMAGEVSRMIERKDPERAEKAAREYEDIFGRAIFTLK